jgi:phage terminase large subunit-like protein
VTRLMAIAGPVMGTLAQKFVDAFNRRDANDLVALVHPAFEWRPSVLVGGRRSYHGHAGLRQWVADLGRAAIHHQARVREVEALDETRFLIISEVLVDGESMTPSAMLGRLGEDGKLVEARAYLTDEPMLRRTGIVGSGASSARAE